MTETFDAVVAGHICLDVIPDLGSSSQEEFAQAFLPGRLLEVGGITFSTGGAVSNTGLALNQLGIKTQLMGKIGDDLFGGAIKKVVSGYGVHLADGMVVDGGVSSSYTIVINPPGTDRIFLHNPAANDTFKANDIRYDLLQHARLFHFGYPPLMKLMFENDGAELAGIFRRAKETGVTTSLDMSLPDPSSAGGQANWAAILNATLPAVDLFLPSIEEILYMLRRETYDSLHQSAPNGDILPLITPQLLSGISQQLLDAGAKIVLIKLGHRGLYLRTGSPSAIKSMGRARPSAPADWANKELWAPVYQVEMAGTTGAGDATIAGFLSGLLRDMSPEETVSAATAVGACNVEAADGLSGLRSWDETMQRIEAGWPRQTLKIDAPGWQFDDRHQMWKGNVI